MDLIINIIPDWPYLQWACAYSGGQRWVPDPTRAVIREIRSDEDGIFLTVDENSRSFTTYIEFSTLPISLHDRILSALERGIGQTLKQAGNIALS